MVIFHHRVVCRLTGRNTRRSTDDTCVYPPLAEAGLQEVDTYIAYRQDTVTKYIATGPIMDLCLATE